MKNIQAGLNKFASQDGFTSANIEGSLLVEDVKKRNTEKGKGEALVVCRRRVKWRRENKFKVEVSLAMLVRGNRMVAYSVITMERLVKWSGIILNESKKQGKLRHYILRTRRKEQSYKKSMSFTTLKMLVMMRRHLVSLMMSSTQYLVLHLL